MSNIISRKKLLSFDDKKLILVTPQKSKIYTFSNGLKYKEFSSALHPFVNEDDHYLYVNFLDQVKETSPFVSFPTNIVASPRKIYGLVSNYELGESFQDINPQMDIYMLMNKLTLLQEEIKRLSYKGWVLQDLHENNILIDENYNIKLIDTDYYYIDQNRLKEEIYKENLVSLYDLLLTSILKNILKGKVLKDKELYRCHCMALAGVITPVEFMAKLVCTLFNHVPERLDVATLQLKML